MNFQLIYDGSRVAAIQYKSLKHWLEENNIEYEFVWKDTGSYCPYNLIIENEEDATYFSLVMTHGSPQLQT
jgi:hypothetical protein